MLDGPGSGRTYRVPLRERILVASWRSATLPFRAAGFDEFLNRLQAVNPSVELRGL